MALVTKTIGKLPVFKDEWVAGVSYSKLNQVTLLGSTFQSKIDNNTSKPAEVVNNELVVNANWTVISNGTAAYIASSRISTLEGKTAQIEQDVNLFNRRPQGLRFKTGYNTVFAKTMKDLVLGTDDFTVCVVARTEGAISASNSVLGFSKDEYTEGSLKVYNTHINTNTNSIDYILFDRTLAGALFPNSISVNKTDGTTNLHHIVITRSGTLVTCTVNGRLVKSVTQDRVLDFSNFIYDIANTSYFWGGAVFNYAMTQAESNKLLWNGGRYDEVRLSEILLDSSYTIIKSLPRLVDSVDNPANTTLTNTTETSFDLSFSNGTSVTRPSIRLYRMPKYSNRIVFNVSFDYNCKSDSARLTQIAGQTDLSYTFTKGSGTFSRSIKSDGQDYIYFRFNGTITTDITISNIKISIQQCLLEYRPENIHSDRYLNSGTAGSDYDLVYSSVKPEIIYEKPYADKVMLDENKAPDWHPIAMGQEVETPTNIFKAKLPDLGKEWQVSDWKQINN